PMTENPDAHVPRSFFDRVRIEEQSPLQRDLRSEVAEQRNHGQLRLDCYEAIERASREGRDEQWAYEVAKDLAAERGRDRSGDRLRKAFDDARVRGEIQKR